MTDEPRTDDAVEIGSHVYGVVPAGRPPLADGATGLDGTPLRLVPRGDLAVVVNDVRLERPPGRKADLMAYREVLDGLAASGPVVPVQFGSVLLDDESALSEVLDGREHGLGELLEELTGRSQFQLRASYHEGVALREIVESDPTIAGLREATRAAPEDAAYAERVRLGELVAHAMEDKRAEDTQVVLDVVMPLVVEVRTSLESSTEGIARIALLVEDPRTEALEAELEALAEAVHERISLSLVGPMAPYDFVEGP